MDVSIHGQRTLDMANATSKSDFVCQAVNFYIRYLHLGKSMNLLAPVLENTVHSEVESAERNLSEMMFKIAVELGMISNQLCNVYQFDRNAENVAEEIASTNGIFTFDEAYLWQDN